MDVTRTTQGQKIAGGSGVALILIMFIFKWFGLKAGPLEGSRNAWGSFGVIDIVLFITALAAIALFVIAATEADLEMPVPLSAIVVGLGALSTLLILIRIISPPDFGTADFGSLVHVDKVRKIGAFLGLIASGVLTYGGYLAMQEEGASFSDLGGGGRTPPPPPGGTGTGAAPPPPPPPPGGTQPPAGGPPPPSGGTGV
jgi:hypothetical protein